MRTVAPGRAMRLRGHARAHVARRARVLVAGVRIAPRDALARRKGWRRRGLVGDMRRRGDGATADGAVGAVVVVAGVRIAPRLAVIAVVEVGAHLAR